MKVGSYIQKTSAVIIGDPSTSPDKIENICTKELKVKPGQWNCYLFKKLECPDDIDSDEYDDDYSGYRSFIFVHDNYDNINEMDTNSVNTKNI